MTGILQSLLGSVSSAAAVATDAFFNLVTLLLPGNGTNGAQNNTFLDSSSNNFTITRNGNTTQGTFSPFSQTGWSNFFTGSNADCLSITNNAAFDFGTGDFTIEAWINPSSIGASQCFVCCFATSGTGFSAWAITVSSTGYLNATIYDGGAAYNFTATNNQIATNTFTHVALTRSSGTSRLFVNGNVCTTTGSVAPNVNSGGWPLFIGRGAYVGFTDPFTGYVSNLRIIKGAAAYTSSFTPSTTNLNVFGSGTTSLLSCQSNRFVDNGNGNSGSGFTISVNTGTPSVQAFSPFLPTAAYSAATVGGSGYFDGSGDYLTASSATAAGSGSFCFEAWIYPTNASAAQMILGNPTTGGMWIGLNIDGANRFGIGRVATAVDNFVSYTWTNNQWHHIAVNRNGTSLQFFVNGTQVGSTATNSINYSTAGRMIGGEGAGTALFTGYISGWRFVNASTYTTTFTVPTAPPTAITNTSLLLNYTNAGITDATAKNDLETVGNAQISTTQSKFGGSSMYFDGTGDYLKGVYSPNMILSGDFTIECWINFSAHGNYGGIISFANGNTGSAPTSGWALVFYQTTDRLYFEAGGGVGIASTNAATANQWNHVAVVRSGSTITHYLNGTANGTGTSSATFTPLTTDNFVIGSNRGFDSSMTGYLDDVRISRYARYTANFTPPTTAFPLQ